MKLQLAIITLLLIFVGCKNSRKLNVDEQKLVEQIAQEEGEKALDETTESTIATKCDTTILRVEEDRSIDERYPPIKLTILESRENIKPVRYSDFGKSVRYIFLKHPTDTSFFRHGARVKFAKSNIIVGTSSGLARFDLNGQFVEMICKDGKKFTVDKSSGMLMATRELMSKYVGSKGDFSVVGDRVFYKYVDNPNGKAWLMEYDASPGKQTLLMPGSFENNNFQGKGEKRSTLEPKGREGIVLLDNNHMLTQQRKFASSKSGIFMTVHALNGDTVCNFRDHDPVTNFSSSVYRGVESGSLYSCNGKMHFRQNFNDTIYRFEGVNRVIPRYVIDAGEKGISSSTEGITPSYNLSEKYVSQNIFETKDLFIYTYSQDYSCPATAKGGSLKFNKFVLNKRTGEQFHAFIDADPYLAEGVKMAWPSSPQKGIENDLDFGIARWPYRKTLNDKVFNIIYGKALKKHVKKNTSCTNLKNKELLESIAQNCADNDVIIMIIE